MLLESITVAIVSQEDIEREILMGTWTKMPSRQAAIVAFFSATYPSVLSGPKTGRDNSKDFSATKTFEEWNKGNSQHSPSITITKSMHDEKKTLVGHINSPLASYPLANDLCLNILAASMDWWKAFVTTFMGFYIKLILNIYKSGKCSKSLKESCWSEAMGAFWLMLDKLGKVRVQAASAHLPSEPGSKRLFLHTTLQ